MPEDTITSAEARLLTAEFQHFRSELGRQGDTLKAISDSLRILTRLEESHTHVLEQLKNGSMTMTDHERRLQDVEKTLPALIETRKWVIGGIIAGVSMIGIALMKLVIVDPAAAAAAKDSGRPQIIYVTPSAMAPAAVPPVAASAPK